MRRLRGRSNEFDLTPLFTKLEVLREMDAAALQETPDPESPQEDADMAILMEFSLLSDTEIKAEAEDPARP